MNQNRTDDERTTRIVTLDFNGGSHIYRNLELGMNIPVRIAPSGISADRAKMLADALNRKYADSHVRFEVGAGSSENASAVHIGRTADFDRYGAFLGLAEGIGEGDAYVLLDDSASDAELLSVIRHEAGHILGTLDHGGAGLARYAKTSTYNWGDLSGRLRERLTTYTTYIKKVAPSGLDELYLTYREDTIFIENWWDNKMDADEDTKYSEKHYTEEFYYDATGVSAGTIKIEGGVATQCTAEVITVKGDRITGRTSSIDSDIIESVDYYQGKAIGCTVNGGRLELTGNAFAQSCTVNGWLYINERDVPDPHYASYYPEYYSKNNPVAENCTVKGILDVGFGGIAQNIIVKSGSATLGNDLAHASFDGAKERYDELISLNGAALATNLIVENGEVEVNYGGVLHNATINGRLTATEGAQLEGAITCTSVDIRNVTPMTTITIKLDLHDYAIANYTERDYDDKNNVTREVEYFANFTTRTTKYTYVYDPDGTVKDMSFTVSHGTFDNKDGRFDMSRWSYNFSATIGIFDELSMPYIVVDFGGTEKDFDSGRIYFSYPTSSEEIPFQMKSKKESWNVTDLGYLLYNGALFGEAADVLWLENGDDEDEFYTVQLAPMMQGATENVIVTGGASLSTPKIHGTSLTVPGSVSTGDLAVQATDSDKRVHHCDVDLIVVPEEIPVIGKLGAKKFSEMLKRAQQNHLTTVADYLPNNIHTKLFGMAFDLTDMGISLTVDWSKLSMTVKMQGKMEWAIGKGKAGTGKQLKLVVDLSGDNYISITGTGDKYYSWDLVGELKVPDFKLGKFEFSNMVLKADKGNASFSASAYVKLPWIKYAFGGSIGIVGGYMDNMSIGVDGLNIPLGFSGLFLQKIEGGISGIATELDLSFNGTLSLTAGPKIDVKFVDWLGLDSGEYSLCELTLSGSLSTSGDFTGTSNCVILGGLATGGGSAGIEGGEIFVTGNFTFLNGCITVKGELIAGNGGITVNGTGTATVPRERVFGPLAGLSMSANVAAVVTENQTSSYVMAWQKITLFRKEYTIGFKSTFTGEVTMLGATDQLKEGDLNTSRSLKSASTKQLFSIGDDLRGERTPSASKTITVNYSGLSLFQFKLSESDASVSLTCDGTEYTQEEIEAGLYENMQVVGELTGDQCITIAVDNAKSGEWTMNAFGDENVTFSVFTIDGGMQKPVFTTTVGETVRSATFGYTLGDLSGLTNVQLSIYRTEKDAGYTGQRIALIESPSADGSWEWVMDDETAGGDFSFYLMVESDGQTPVFSDISEAYAFRTIDIEAPDQIQFISSEWTSAGTLITWDAPWDDQGIAGYIIRYASEDTGTDEQSDAEEKEMTETDVKISTFTFDNVPNGMYDFRIAAYDAAGNLSEWSKEQSVLVLTDANATYKDVTLTEALELAEYESAVNITAGEFTVTAAENSLISGSLLGDAEIKGILMQTAISGEASLMSSGSANGITVNGTFTVYGKAEGVTVADGGTLAIGEDGFAENITVASGGSLALMPYAGFSSVAMEYGSTLVITGGISDRFQLTDDIVTAGTLETYRYISGSGHKVRFEQYKQTAEFKTASSSSSNDVHDDIAFLKDMDRLIDDLLEVEIDPTVFGRFKIADKARYFDGTITVINHADGSSVEVGLDRSNLVGNSLCKLSKEYDGLYLNILRSEIDAPVTTVEGSELDTTNTIQVTATPAANSGKISEYSFRYSLNEDMSDAVIITGKKDTASISKKDLVDNATYYVQSCVENENGVMSLWGDTVSFTVTPKALPPAPATLMVTNATNPSTSLIKLEAKSEVGGDTVRQFRFRYADNPEMNNEIVRTADADFTSDYCYSGYIFVFKSDIVDGQDYYVEAGQLIGNEWSYWSDPVVFNTQGWDYDGTVIDTEFVLDGMKARNVTVASGGILRAKSGTLNGAVIAEGGLLSIGSDCLPTLSGTILIRGTMESDPYDLLTTDAQFVFDLGAHENAKDSCFIDKTGYLTGTRTFTVKLDDTPETGTYSLADTLGSGVLAISLEAADGTALGTLSKEPIVYNGLHYSLSDKAGYAYLVVSEGGDLPLIGKIKLSKKGKVYAAQDYCSNMTVSSAGECDYMLVENEGTIYDTTVGKGGKVDLFGMVSGAVIESGGEFVMKDTGLSFGSITIRQGGKMTVEGGEASTWAYFYVSGTMTLSGALRNADPSAELGPLFTFDLYLLSAPNANAMISDYTMLQCNPEFAICASEKQAAGDYKLIGNAAGFSGSISVGNSKSLSVGDECTINGTRYALALKKNILTLTVGKGSGGGTEQEKPAMPDGGENNDPLDENGKPNGNVEDNTLKSINDKTINMDTPGSVSEGEYNNYVGGTEDKADYGQIMLSKAAKLSFTVKADSKVKLTFYELVEKTDGTYKKKSLKTVTVSSKNGGEKTTASVLVEGGTGKLYYVAVENKNKKNAGAYYNVSLNTKEGKDQSKFFSDGDNGDNNFLWNKTDKWNEKVHGEDVDALVIDGDDIGKAIQIDTDAETVVEHDGFTNYVGFGDAADIRKIELKSAAKLSFDLAKTTGGAAKLIVYTVNDSGKMVVANSKLTVTTKAAAPSGSVKNPVVLQKGMYYIAVQSTDAKKGKEAYYNVSLNANSVFYEDGDSNLNDFISKTKKVSAEVVANAKDLEIGAFQIDGILQVEGDSAVEYTDAAGKVYANFVGTGDTSDVVRINANDGMKLSLKVTATDAVSLVVYGLQKNGTLKALKTVKSKNNVAELNDFELKAKSAPGGQFFLGVTSTNAKKGSAAFYNVDVINVSGQDSAPFSASVASSLAMPETDSLGISDALSFSQYDSDALADASASALAELDDKTGWQSLLA